jgi:hypothetical protein
MRSEKQGSKQGSKQAKKKKNILDFGSIISSSSPSRWLRLRLPVRTVLVVVVVDEVEEEEVDEERRGRGEVEVMLEMLERGTERRGFVEETIKAMEVEGAVFIRES